MSQLTNLVLIRARPGRTGALDRNPLLERVRSEVFDSIGWGEGVHAVHAVPVRIRVR
jgi:hypothetical protein